MKAITAIGNPEINERLKEEKIYEIIGMDIQYQEGIIEILEENKEIEVVLISNNLPEEMDFYILISKILNINKKIDIIVFLKEQNEDIERFLNSKKIYKIYYLDNYELFFLNIKNKTTTNKDVSKNIEDFKKIIMLEKNKNLVKTSNRPINENYDNIYVFSGSYGSGKSIMSILFAKYLSRIGKTVLIDCDFFNKSINTMLGISKYPKDFNKENIFKTIQKYQDNLYILTCLENVMDSNFTMNKIFYIYEILEKIKEEFEFIVIDTSANIIDEKNSILFDKADKLIFLIEPNLSELKKSNMYLEKILKDCKIQKDKINIIFNKVNANKLSKKVLNEIYSEMKVVGEIEYSISYSLMINKNRIFENDICESVFNKII